MNSLSSTIKLFKYYKSLGEKAMSQVSDEALCWVPDIKSNSICVIVRHLHGNMLSRWTDFLTSDGEKSWRNRDEEFEEASISREDIMSLWNDGWTSLFNTLDTLNADDLQKIVYIRNEGQTAEDAIMRQLAHYAYHVGQIVYLARLANEGNWQSLSIPKSGSNIYNEARFTKEKSIRHFSDDISATENK